MDNYPEDEDIEEIKNWPFEKGFIALMEFIQSIWWMSEWGFSRRKNSFYISTGGWSGNEEIIGAMQQNFIFWSQCWVSSKRGGYYRFHIPKRLCKASLAPFPTEESNER